MTNDGGVAAEALKKDSCAVAVIDGKNKKAFLDAFSGATAQPQESGVIDGLNSGHGTTAVLTVYVLPKVAP